MFIHVCASAQVEARDISGIDPQVLPFLLETGSIPGLELSKLANLTIQEAPGTSLSLPLWCWRSRHMAPSPASFFFFFFNAF